MQKAALKLNDEEKVFELPVSRHAEIKKIRQEQKQLKNLWDMVW